MADERRAERMARLAEWREKAYAHGGPVGLLLCRSFETMLTVVKDGIANETSVSLALESFTRERDLYYSRDAERNDPQRELLYHLSEAISTMIQSILDEIREQPRATDEHRRADEWAPVSQDDCASDVTLPKFDPMEMLKMEEEIITLDDDDDENDQPCSSTACRTPTHRSTLLDAYQAHVGSNEDAAAASLTCNTCHLSFPTEEKLRKHALQHSIIPCPIIPCKAQIPRIELMKHLNDEHEQASGSNQPAPLFRSAAEQKVEDEEAKEEAGQDSVRSDSATPSAMSSAATSSAASTPAAAAAAEGDHAATATGGLMKCTHLGCTFSCATQIGLKCHWKVHSDYKCDICSRSVMTADRLERHMEKFHAGVETKKREKPAEVADKKQKRKRRKRWGWAESEDEDYRPGGSSRKNSAAAAASPAATFLSSSAAAAAVAAAAEAATTANSQ